MKPESKKTALLLLVNTVILMTLYFWVATKTNFPYIHYIYLAAGAALGLGYVIYNRGFSGKGITPEMLPESMTPIQKQEFLEDSRRRLHKSRWMLTVLLPIILTFAADLCYLFLVPYLQELFA